MPKRTTHTFESERDGLKDDELTSLFCLCCGEAVLVLGPGVSLCSLPKRRTDGALVLARGETVYKLKAKPGESKLLRREKGYEKQWRSNCWNCGVPIAYRCVPEEASSLTYLLADAIGAQADLYLQLYQVPPCISEAGPGEVRIALEVNTEQPKKAITHVSNAEVGVAVCAPNREGLANAEVLELLTKVLGSSKQQLQLSRGASPRSRSLLVMGMSAVAAFKALGASVETEILPFHATSKPAGALGGVSDDMGPSATVGAASNVARRQWEEGSIMQELAEAPTMKQQVFRN